MLPLAARVASCGITTAALNMPEDGPAASERCRSCIRRWSASPSTVYASLILASFWVAASALLGFCLSGWCLMASLR